MRNLLITLCCVVLGWCSADAPASASSMLPNGWALTPAGRTIGLPGDMPAAMALTNDRKYLIVTTAGYHDHTVNVISLASGRIVQSVPVAKQWFGLAVAPASGDVYVPGGGPSGASSSRPGYEAVHRYTFSHGMLTACAGQGIGGLDDALRWTAGIACGGDDDLFVVNTNTDAVFKLSHGTVVSTAVVGYRPLACALSPDRSLLAVTNWGGKSVTLLRAASLALQGTVPVGSHPCAAVWTETASGARQLFVANSGSNSVSVIAPSQGGVWHVAETINTALTEHALCGSTPIALAASHDGRRLYVANADNNDVAVVDIADPDESRVLGFIPTGWYPSTVAVAPDDRTLFVGVGKGLASRANWPAEANDGHTQPDGSNHFDYIGHCLTGAVSIVPLPDAPALATYTREVLNNVPHPPAASPSTRLALAAFANIKHVLYIIRENRTYDQVFGDIAAGNGDPDLVLFGRNVTPNAHALAMQTVLLDNLYVNGEVSEDGHQWCNAAYATDFTEKAWEGSYSGRGEPDGDDRLYKSPGGYLWDNCAAHGLTYRSYGEFADFYSNPGAPPTFIAWGSLAGHASEEWSAVPSWESGRDQARAQVFIDELHAAEAAGKWPAFIVMHLFEDHTQGLKAGAFSPVAEVADNDRALGDVVDAVTHSKFWKSTAIFVIEDDAQDGPDHVDCHRTVGLVISPYTKRGVVDHTHYTTASFVRTIELMLHLPSMSQYDQNATPLYNCFSGKPALVAYDCRPAQVDLMARNPATGPGAVASSKLDLTDIDRADPQALNHILWNALRPGAPMPAPVISAWSGPDLLRGATLSRPKRARVFH